MNDAALAVVVLAALAASAAHLTSNELHMSAWSSESSALDSQDSLEEGRANHSNLEQRTHTTHSRSDLGDVLHIPEAKNGSQIDPSIDNGSRLVSLSVASEGTDDPGTKSNSTKNGRGQSGANYELEDIGSQSNNLAESSAHGFGNASQSKGTNWTRGGPGSFAGDTSVELRGHEPRPRPAAPLEVSARVAGDVHFSLRLPPPAPCPAPAARRLHALLGNMMNELTKVFVRANMFLRSKDNTRFRASAEAQPRAQPDGAPQGSRFKVVSTKNTQFFEEIFHNMTKEFSGLREANATSRAGAVGRMGYGPEGATESEGDEVCQAPLLRRSLATFRRAALRCVQNYLKIQDCNKKTKRRLAQFLSRELVRMRRRHARIVCDQRDCYEGLLP